ncbi:hypothetical protein J8J27_23595, partial [Mycobacterium tuberculosis]|nr:hypothetical protein [Mycobacterium tuberculosis]
MSSTSDILSDRLAFNEIAASVTDAVAQQGDASAEIAASIQTASTGTGEVARVVAAVEDSSSASK